VQKRQASGWKIYRQGGVKKTRKWYKKTGNGVEKRQAKGREYKKTGKRKGVATKTGKKVV